MQIYFYDELTGEYTSQAVARVNPAFGEHEPDQPQYLMPANATSTAPPALGDHQAAVHLGGAWAVVPDFRGAVAYLATTGALTPVTQLGKTLADLGLVAVKPAAPPPAEADFTMAVQARLDTEARTRGYDGILSACSYATSTNATFKAQGLACVAWRDAVWSYGYAQLSLVQGGQRALPTVAGLVAELPPMVWPA